MALGKEIGGAAVSATDKPASPVVVVTDANLNPPEHAKPQLTNTPVKSPSAPRPQVKTGR